MVRWGKDIGWIIGQKLDFCPDEGGGLQRSQDQPPLCMKSKASAGSPYMWGVCKAADPKLGSSYVCVFVQHNIHQGVVKKTLSYKKKENPFQSY